MKQPSRISYARQYAAQQPLEHRRAPAFWEKVNKEGPVPEYAPALGCCWIFIGDLVPEGYGRFWDGTRQVGAHRFAYEQLVGPIPEGRHLDHLCRVRNCVRSSHLEPVTRRENILRGAGWTAQNVIKTHCPKGHPYDEANTRMYQGRRHCRACSSVRPWPRERVVPVMVPLSRPVCGGGCVLLAQHSGKCTASNGKQWVKA